MNEKLFRGSEYIINNYMKKSNLFFLLFILLFLSCKPQETPLVRIGTNIWTGYEPLYLAKSLGSFKKSNIRLIQYDSATEVLRAFRNRVLEGASLTLDEVLLLKQDKIPIKIILVHDVSHGGDVILARPPIKSMKDLIGKKVAVESNALGAYVITRALEKNNMSPNDIKILSIDVNAHESAYHSQKVDAVVTFDPARTKILKAGANEIFSSKEIPNEIIDVMVIHDDVVKKNPIIVNQIHDAWFEAVKYLSDHPDKASSILAKRQKITPQKVLDNFKYIHIPTKEENYNFIKRNPPLLINNIQLLNRVLLQYKLIKSKVDTTDLFIQEK